MDRLEEVVDEILRRLAIIRLRLMVQIAIKNDQARCDRPHEADPVGDRAQGGHLTGDRPEGGRLTGDPGRESRVIEDPVTGGLETGGHTPEVAHCEGTVDHEAGEGEKEHHLGESLEIEGRGAIDEDWTPRHGGVAPVLEQGARGARTRDPGFKNRIRS